MADHSGERASGRTVCRVCGLSWRRSAPAWLAWCPGVTIYDFVAIPAELATKTQLAREGLRLSRDTTPSGCYVAWTRKAVVPLYDRRQAIPKRAARSDRERVRSVGLS
jgi:hypothetical protein